MTRWRIHPADVDKAITKAERDEQTLRGITQDVRTHPSSDETPGADAIAEFIHSRVQPLEWMDTRITDVVHATGQVVTAYRDGDLEMAAEQQAAAATIGSPDPSRDPVGTTEP